MNNEPVVWMLLRNESCVELTEWYGVMRGWEEFLGDNEKIVELYTHPAKTPAKQRYDDCMKDCDEPNPIERLRFFLSCALTGQDGLDVEPFIDAITHPAKTLTDEEIHNLFLSFCNVGFTQVDEIGFARAILRKAQE